MTVVFVTNFYNHHQKFLADELYSLLGGSYYLIETEKISQERIQMGWGGEEKPGYVLQSHIDETIRIKAQEIVDAADVVILGSASYSWIKTRLKNGRLTFLYSERIYKTGTPFLKLPVHFLRNLKKFIRYKNCYLLAASAYAPLDYARALSFIGKSYKWGYFTEFIPIEHITETLQNKVPNSILWVARFIPWKHPELALAVAERLKQEGYHFHLNMIGTGELAASIQEQIQDKKLSDCVTLLGVMSPQQVREQMMKSELFLFTSDRNEGWGAVLNESMNSGCAVVASHAIGSVPFMVEHQKNGLIYHDGDLEDLYQKVRFLLEHKTERLEIQTQAYRTIETEWNPRTAAQRFVRLATELLREKGCGSLYTDGVCSKAKVLFEGGFKL